MEIEDVVVKSKQIYVKKKESRVENHVKLPKIEITKFSGDPTEWQTFFDSFECSIHKSESLSRIEKMNYLINMITGEAAVIWRAMSANIMCVVYVKILCAVCMQTCGVYASRCGVYASMCGVYASTCGVYESTCGVYAYVWCVCQNHVWCVCQNHVRCVCQKFVSGVYVTYVIKFMCSV